MKTQTLELIIEELATALNTERWVNESQREKIAALENQIADLKIEIADKALKEAIIDGKL